MHTLPSLPDAVLDDAFARWKEVATAELKGAPFEKKLVARTPEGIPLQPIYTRADTAKILGLDLLPGEAPYLRGFRKEAAGARSWEIAQEIRADESREFNARLLSDLFHGQDSVVLSPDSASRAGSDPDEAPSEEFEDGLSLSDRAAFDAALRGVDFRAVPVHLAAGNDARPLAALALASIRGTGCDCAELSGSITADPLSFAAETGEIPSSFSHDFDALASWTKWASLNTPKLRTVSIDASLWADAGATATQELGLAMAAAVEYIKGFFERDLTIDVVAPRIQFQFAVGPHFFTEIAKLRAFRLLWPRVLRVLGGDAAFARRAAISARTGRWNKSLLDPHVNMLRTTTEALSAVLGGCNRLHLAPFDEETGSTNDFSRRIARNIHVLLAEEFGIALTADPAGGSWYVERLTHDLAKAAWKQFQDIESRGGFAACLRSEYLQESVGASSAAKSDALAKRRRALVGTNLFPNLSEIPLHRTEIAADARLARVREFAARRPSPSFSPAAAPFALETFEAALSAAAAGATVGQLSRFLGKRSSPAAKLPRVLRSRGSLPFEQLRQSVNEFTARTGNKPRVFLAKMGPALQHKGRADFSAAFFATGGFEVLAKKSFSEPELAAEEAVVCGARIAVLCSSDESYLTLAPSFAETVKRLNPKVIVVLAGLPTDPATMARYRAAGFDEFIHLQSNVLESLTGFLAKIETNL